MLQDEKFNTEIAEAYERERQPYRHIPQPPVLLIFSAIPGSGKTTLAKRLVRDLRAQYVNHDDMRHIVRERGVDPADFAMSPISRIVINHMVKHDENKFVIIDASCDRSWSVYYDHVKELGAMSIVIRLDPPLDVIRERLRARDGDDGELLSQLDRFKDEFDNCCQHVEADITVGAEYDYDQVLQVVKNKLSGASKASKEREDAREL